MKIPRKNKTKETAPRSIRFDKGDLKMANRLKINIAELCRQSLKRALETGR